MGDKTKKAMAMRKAATSSLLKASIPRFIKIKELPQTMDRKIKMSQD